MLFRSATITLADLTTNYGDAAFAVAATSDAGGAITYASSNLNVATINGSQVTIVGAGTATITASQVTDTNYNAARTTALLTVNKIAPIISLGSITKYYGDAAFTVAATSNAGGAITYTSSNLDVATISGSQMTIVGAGTATTSITASWNPA